MNIKKLLGILLTLFGAFLIILATFVPPMNFLLDQPFNWFISLCLLFIVGGLVLHIVFNKTMPLDDDEDDDIIDTSKVSKDIERDIEATEVKAKNKIDIKEDVTLVKKAVKSDETKKL